MQIAEGIIVPGRIRRLPVCAERSIPVPWFVQWFDDGKPSAQGVGKPDFRVIDTLKYAIAVKQKRCWVCGGILGRHLAFTAGPMCAILRISGEPPSHRECAEFSARACPFLSRPDMVRREDRLPDAAKFNPLMLERNPGVAMVWITLSYTVHQDSRSVICAMGDPVELLFFKNGRDASREEVMNSINSGLPSLTAAAETEGENSVREVFVRYGEAKRLVEQFCKGGNNGMGK